MNITIYRGDLNVPDVPFDRLWAFLHNMVSLIDADYSTFRVGLSFVDDSNLSFSFERALWDLRVRYFI